MKLEEVIGMVVMIGALGACWRLEEDALAPVPRVLGVEPRAGVPPTEPVAVVFSEAVFPSGRWPIQVRRADGRIVPVQVDAKDEGTSVALRPLDGWPSGERLSVELSPGLANARGRPLEVGEAVLAFETASQRTPPSFALRFPPPGSRAPFNLAGLVLSVTPREVEVSEVRLRGPRGVIEGRIDARSAEGVLAVALVGSSGDGCATLCPGEDYEVTAGAGIAPVDRSLGTLSTATVSDRQAPELELLSVDHGGGRLGLSLSATEPVVVQGTLTSAEGARVALDGSLVPSSFPRLSSRETLPPDQRFMATIEAIDPAGLRSESLEVAVVTPGSAAVHFSEVVTTPLHDWGDSEPMGQPFDGQPGDGAVTESDEWVELVNVSPGPIDAEALLLTLRVIDPTPSETRLWTLEESFSGSGGSPKRWLPGEALAFRPRGSMSQRGLALEIWSGSARLDRLVLGSSGISDHPGGRPPDLVHEALAKGADGRWAWCRPSPGDSAPPLDCL